MGSPSLKVIAGNRLETLAGDLARRLSRGRDPFAKETVVAPSKGAAKWLVSWIAKNDGVCANLEIKLPKDFIVGTLCGLSKESVESVSQESVRWRIYKALPGLIRREPELFAAPAAYIEEGGEMRELKRWQLAGKLAACFDQYMTLRPDMVLDWERRPGSSTPARSLGKRSAQWLKHWRWQRSLWLETMAALPSHPPREFERILNGGLKGAKLPNRVFAFGFSTLPPVYFEILVELGRHVESCLHYLNPCQAYWAEAKSEKESLKELAKLPPEEWDDLHLDSPNELLASFGKAGREFFFKLVEASDSIEMEELFDDSGDELPSNALKTLQRGVREMLPAAELAASAKLNRSDASVRTHSCHSRMREVEALRDEILGALDEGSREGVESPLAPSDILVMAPDISKYVPFIKAAFGGERRGSLKLDFSVADQSLGAESPEAAAFLSILKLPQGRFASEEVLAPLDCQAVRERLKLDAEDVAWLRVKLREAGVSWGADAEQRREAMRRDGADEPPFFEENSWRFALDRLMLGHAMEKASSLEASLGVDGGTIAPLGLPEGDGANAAGRLSVYFDKLEDFAKAAAKESSVQGWQALLLGVFDDFLLSGKESSDGALAAFSAVSKAFSTAAQAAGPDCEIPYEVALAALGEALAAESSGGGFLRGGVTFCRMQPLRNVPARVICLLGMNDKEFPRSERERGFDLLREGRRLCDRSPRDDDRQLFLDAILSARESLRVFYVGQSDKDNSPLPPSPAVNELEDHLKAVFGGSCLKLLRFRHPLHPFSSKCFSAEARKAWRERAARASDDAWNFALSSYSFADLEASRALSARREGRGAPWASRFSPLALPEEVAKAGRFEIDANRLAFALRNLPKRFLKERLGVAMERPGEESLPSDEPFSQDSLQEYKLKDALLESLLAKPELDVKDAYRFHRACGELSPGAAGYMRFAECFERVSGFAASISSLAGKPLASPPFRVEIPLSELGEPLRAALFPELPEKLLLGVELKASKLYEGGLAFFRPSSLKAKDWLAAWTGHLLLRSLEKPPAEGALLFGLQGDSVQKEGFLRVERAEARRLLAFLAALCAEGLRRPLPLFPESSLAYARSFRQRAGGELELALGLWPEEDAFKAADREWEEDSFSHVEPESKDPSFRFCFGAAPLSKLSSETALADRTAALGAAPEGGCQAWLDKAPARKLELYRESLALEREFHALALLCFLPLLGGVDASSGRDAR